MAMVARGIRRKDDRKQSAMAPLVRGFHFDKKTSFETVKVRLPAVQLFLLVPILRDPFFLSRCVGLLR
jgi:hypothetical protein